MEKPREDGYSVGPVFAVMAWWHMSSAAVACWRWYLPHSGPSRTPSPLLCLTHIFLSTPQHMPPPSFDAALSHNTCLPLPPARTLPHPATLHPPRPPPSIFCNHSFHVSSPLPLFADTSNYTLFVSLAPSPPVRPLPLSPHSSLLVSRHWLHSQSGVWALHSPYHHRLPHQRAAGQVHRTSAHGLIHHAGGVGLTNWKIGWPVGLSQDHEI